MWFIFGLTALTIAVVYVVRTAMRRTSEAVSEIHNHKSIEEWGVHHSAGLSALHQGDLATALAHFNESHAIAEAHDDFDKLASSRRSLARVHEELAAAGEHPR